MRIAVCGAGYVGLASAAVLAHIGHEIRVLDIDPERIAALDAGRDPLGEPGLVDALRSDRLAFTASAADAYRDAAAIVVAVGTPNDGTGSPDLSQLYSAAKAIAEHAAPTTVLIRSTVPVGTCDALEALVLRSHRVLANPEFLREGRALEDSLNPARIVCGGPSAETVTRSVYGPILSRQVAPLGAIHPSTTDVPLYVMDRRSAELAKYATNAFLATKLSFVNEIANIASMVGADIRSVIRVVGSDPRVGPAFLRPGIGWGGSCFPKDTRALDALSAENGYEFTLLRAVIEENNAQLMRFYRLVTAELPPEGGRVGLLGLAFKAGTADIRESPAIALADLLLGDGRNVRAFDPAVAPDAPGLPSRLEVVASAEAAAADCDVIAIATEWPEFASLDYARLRAVMRGDVVLDGRCVIDAHTVRAAGLRYGGICAG